MRWFRLGLILGLLLQAEHVSAQSANPYEPNPIEQAGKLADRGEELFNQGDYAGAIQALSQADKLFHAPTFLRLSAQAHEKLGKLVEAQQIYQSIVDMQLPAGASDPWIAAQEGAKKDLAALAPRIPKLQLTIGGASIQTLRVSLDGGAFDSKQLGQPVPQNPGTHELIVEATGLQKVVQNVVLAEGATVPIEIRLIPVVAPRPTATAIATAAPPGAPTASPEAPRRVPVMTYVAYGAGAVGLVVGGVLGGMAITKKNDFGNNPTRTIADERASFAIGADLAFSFALISAVAGTVLWVKPPDNDKPAKTTSVFVAPHTDGLVLGGSF